MVRIVNGNLLDATEDVICHQVNCMGVMGSGVAKAIREKWPEVFQEYSQFVYDMRSTPLLGKVEYVEIEDGRFVANMFSQANYGYDGRRYTSYDAFYNCLVAIEDDVDKGASIAFPYKIASDRGGASWNVIYAMICDVLGDRDVVIYRFDEVTE